MRAGWWGTQILRPRTTRCSALHICTSLYQTSQQSLFTVLNRHIWMRATSIHASAQYLVLVAGWWGLLDFWSRPIGRFFFTSTSRFIPTRFTSARPLLRFLYSFDLGLFALARLTRLIIRNAFEFSALLNSDDHNSRHRLLELISLCLDYWTFSFKINLRGSVWLAVFHLVLPVWRETRSSASKGSGLEIIFQKT